MTKSESRASVVEQIARAICKAAEGDPDTNVSFSDFLGGGTIPLWRRYTGPAEDAIRALESHRLAGQDRGEPLERMVALDEEIEAQNPGWMTGHPDDGCTKLRRALEAILKESVAANIAIKLNRDGQGSGRVKVATAMHRIGRFADEALSAAPRPIQVGEGK